MLTVRRISQDLKSAGYQRQDDCPSCGGNLFVNKQNAVKDWDYGVDKGAINDSINCQQ